MKVRYDLVDPEAIHGIALAFTSGLDKGYAEEDWRSVPKHKYIAAYQRHMREHRRGNLFDEETGLLHIDHALANLVILRSFTVADISVRDQMDKGEYK